MSRTGPAALQILSQHRQLVIAGQHHLVTRGQKAGHIRADLPRDWLVATYYALLHAAADEVSATVGAALAQPDA